MHRSMRCTSSQTNFMVSGITKFFQHAGKNDQLIFTWRLSGGGLNQSLPDTKRSQQQSHGVFHACRLSLPRDYFPTTRSKSFIISNRWQGSLGLGSKVKS